MFSRTSRVHTYILDHYIIRYEVLGLNQLTKKKRKKRLQFISLVPWLYFMYVAGFSPFGF